MRELHDVTEDHAGMVVEFREGLEEAKRAWAAGLLAAAPKARLQEVADRVRDELGADAIEINAILPDAQVTVASAPRRPKELRVSLSDSLCVTSVALGEPLSVSDIEHDPITAKHRANTLGIHSWASAPIFIEDCAAGTVCALEMEHARVWSDADELVLKMAADSLKRVVEDWLETN